LRYPGCGLEDCPDVLRRARACPNHSGWGWSIWPIHVAPSFGEAGSTIQDRLREFDQRRELRRLLHDVDVP
jgi:hypothetical protein